MTSTVEPGGASLGFINHAFIERGSSGTPFDNYGGEDRFWLGPEGGQFGLYFDPGEPFTLRSWRTPRTLQEGAWTIVARDDAQVAFKHHVSVINRAGTVFDVAIDRTVRALSRQDVEARFGAMPRASKWVSFESVNRITNAGLRPWTRGDGLLSIWILGMFRSSPDTRVVIPFATGVAGPIVNDAYFGKVPQDRIAVRGDAGWLAFVADGARRGKIGIAPRRSLGMVASFRRSEGLLSLVRHDQPLRAADGYANSAWETQADPYAGDVLNAYNDGPAEPGASPGGGYYELETSSPAAALQPGQSIQHSHTTLHAVGDPNSLDRLARRLLGVSLGDVC